MLTKYGLEAAFSLLLMLIVAGLWCRREKIGYGAWIRLCLLTIPFALVGSRLLFGLSALGNGDMTSPMQVLYAWDGGASITGAFAGSVLAAFLTEKWRRIPHGRLLDGIGLGAPLAILAERLCEPAHNELGIGRMVDTEFLSFLGNLTDERHPVFLYEAGFAFILLAVLLHYATGKRTRRSGDVLLTFMTLYGSAQMFLESLRDDSHMVIYFIRINQIAALIMVLIPFVIWMVRWVRKGAKKPPVLIACAVLLLAIIKGIIQEFAVDSDPNLLWEYSQMALCVTVMAAVTLLVRGRANAEKE